MALRISEHKFSAKKHVILFPDRGSGDGDVLLEATGMVLDSVDAVLPLLLGWVFQSVNEV